MSLDNVGFNICLLETSNSMIILTFFSLGVNQSDPRTSSTTNCRFYRALGRLHGPQCKQPLNAKSKTSKLFEKWWKLELTPQRAQMAINPMWHITKTKETPILSLAIQQWRSLESVLRVHVCVTMPNTTTVDSRKLKPKSIALRIASIPNRKMGKVFSDTRKHFEKLLINFKPQTLPMCEQP